MKLLPQAPVGFPALIELNKLSILSVFCGFCLIWLSWLVVLQTNKKDARLNTERLQLNSKALVNSISENASMVLNVAANQMTYLMREYEEHSQLTDDLNDLCKTQRDIFGYNDVYVANASGNVIASALPMKNPLNIAKWPHFQFHVATATSGMHIGNPVLSKVSGTLSILLSTRINNRDGSFGGIVSIDIQPSDFIQRTDQKSNTEFILVGTDHIIRYRSIKSSEPFSQFSNYLQLFDKVNQKNSGSFDVISPADGHTGHYSYRFITGYPLISIVGSSINSRSTNNLNRASAYLLFGSFSNGVGKVD